MRLKSCPAPNIPRVGIGSEIHGLAKTHSSGRMNVVLHWDVQRQLHGVIAAGPDRGPRRRTKNTGNKIPESGSVESAGENRIQIIKRRRLIALGQSETK